MAARARFEFNDIHRYLDTLFGEDLHAKRVYSLANATLGVLTSASLAVHLIGQGLAQERARLTKHAVKQIDRLLPNQGFEVWSLFGHWVGYVVGARKRIMVAMDWTEFDADGHGSESVDIGAALITVYLEGVEAEHAADLLCGLGRHEQEQVAVRRRTVVLRLGDTHPVDP